MILNKKAQSLSTNTVIILILGVIVLAVVLFILKTGAGESFNSIFDCQPSRGECVAKNTCDSYLKVSGKCYDDKQKVTTTKECCAKIK